MWMFNAFASGCGFGAATLSLTGNLPASMGVIAGVTLFCFFIHEVVKKEE